MCMNIGQPYYSDYGTTDLDTLYNWYGADYLCPVLCTGRAPTIYVNPQPLYTTSDLYLLSSLAHRLKQVSEEFEECSNSLTGQENETVYSVKCTLEDLFYTNEP